MSAVSCRLAVVRYSPIMSDHLLGEVFGYPADDNSEDAMRHRRDRLCPYGNITPNCTKDSVEDPLGVCSVWAGGELNIICPVRFREQSRAVSDAAEFFFGLDAKWTSFPEIRLKGGDGRAAGNVDYVLVEYDDRGRVTDFGSLEIQAVYISGNIRNPFRIYMDQLAHRAEFVGVDYGDLVNRPRPDFLSSTRKRLAPQLMFKGAIFQSWGKKQAVAVNKGLWDTLPPMTRTAREESDLAWFVYDLVETGDGRRSLELCEVAYSTYENAMLEVTKPVATGPEGFVATLQARLDAQLAAGPTRPEERLV